MWALTTSDGRRVADIHSETDARRIVHNCAGPTPGTSSTAKGVCSSLRSGIDRVVVANGCRTQSAHCGDWRHRCN
jgi:hypothetical protein